jgi:hypothetical protein
MNIRDQLQRNQLAIISLLVALAALGYNTWRNELSEHNRTVRAAGFEMLVHIAELQRITYLAHYDQDSIGGNPRKGWTEVLIMKDLAELLPTPVQLCVAELASAWESNWQILGQNSGAIEPIEVATDKLRVAIQKTLRELD